MEVFEITDYRTGMTEEGVNYLLPSESFASVRNGYIYRQVLQSRRGLSLFAPRLADNSRISGIFQYRKPDGSLELLATDANYLYRYNTVTQVFDQIPFSGNNTGYGGFGLTASDAYVSGTSYPTASNGERFVFTSEQMTANASGSGVFFYDGTSVLDYTDAGDNIDYVAPTSGALFRAQHVLYFNERLNFISPVVNSVLQEQGILFSGIRASSGNGDKYNVAGSGIILLDTYESIQGAQILGNVMLLTLTDAPWVLEKSADAFNPYNVRKVPSVIGTNGAFSAAQYNAKIESVGVDGISRTDGRQSERFDNKIPYFTKQNIAPDTHTWVYAGYDRQNGQFLYSYADYTTDPTTQDKVLTHNYEENTWSIYDMRVTAFGYTTVGTNLAWSDIDETNKPEWAAWATTSEIWSKIGITANSGKLLAGDAEGFIYEMNVDTNDYVVDISAITQAGSAVLTVAESAFKVGDQVVVYNVEGMTEINNVDPSSTIDNYTPYEVTAATNTSVTLNVNSTNFTAATPSTGQLAKVIEFEARMQPFNPWRSQGVRCYLSMLEVLIDNTAGSCLIDVYVDGETTPIRKDILMRPRDTRKARSWVQMAVNTEADFFNIVIKQKSPTTIYSQTSMRLHAQPGGESYG